MVPWWLDLQGQIFLRLKKSIPMRVTYYPYYYILCYTHIITNELTDYTIRWKSSFENSLINLELYESYLGSHVHLPTNIQALWSLQEEYKSVYIKQHINLRYQSRLETF